MNPSTGAALSIEHAASRTPAELLVGTAVADLLAAELWLRAVTDG